MATPLAVRPPLLAVLAASALAAAPAGARSELAACLEARSLVRLARVAEPGGASSWARVVEAEDGIPSGVVPFAADPHDPAAAFERAAALPPGAPVRPITPAEVCAPVVLDQGAIDAETRVVVAAGLNYAAHAEEAGGGDVFLFPKPVAPGAPYGEVSAPAGVTLLDYEVELAFVLLADVDLRALPSRDALLARSAFFVANDVTDREPIIRQAALSGPGTGFVEGKGQPHFLPAGPWLVRGRELLAARDACRAEGLGLRLEVDEGDGFRTRQEAATDAMILDPRALLERIAEEVAREGVRSPMPVRRPHGVRDYPLAVAGPGDALRLPAGSIVLTGTPEGVALQAPSPLAVLARGLLRLRGPFEQFRQEELARAAEGAPGGYLAPGHRVRARIDGLGSQMVRIGRPGRTPPPDPCNPTPEAPTP